MDFLNDFSGILTISSVAAGSVWILSRGMESLRRNITGDMKGDMKNSEERMTKKIESDIKRSEESLMHSMK